MKKQYLTVKYNQFVPRLDPLYSSAVAYCVYDNGEIGTEVVNFDIDMEGPVQFMSHLRAARKQAKRMGKRVKPLPESAMRETIVVLVGPRTGPKAAIGCLQRLAALIEKDGLVAGLSGSDDEYFEYEHVDPKQAPVSGG